MSAALGASVPFHHDTTHDLMSPQRVLTPRGISAYDVSHTCRLEQ